MRIEVDHLIASEPLAEARDFADAAGVIGEETHVFNCVHEGARGAGFCNTHQKRCNVGQRVDDVYLWTPPCQSCSVQSSSRYEQPEGEPTVALGAADKGGFCVRGGFAHMLLRTPRLAILENPEGLMFVAKGETASPWDVPAKRRSAA